MLMNYRYDDLKLFHFFENCFTKTYKNRVLFQSVSEGFETVLVRCLLGYRELFHRLGCFFIVKIFFRRERALSLAIVDLGVYVTGKKQKLSYSYFKEVVRWVCNAMGFASSPRIISSYILHHRKLWITDIRKLCDITDR